jgi:hypothetical protein
MTILVVTIIFLGLLAPGALESVERRQAPEATPVSGQSIAAEPDLTCSDFGTPAEAQLVLDADPADPNGLDVDLDGIACETPLVTPADNTNALFDDRTAQRAARREAREATTPAGAAQDLDCVDFDFQEEAQVVYDHFPDDPYNLDPSGDGFACSSLPSRGS